MRIGVVTTSLPARRGAVSGAFVLETCRALAERGHELEVVAPAPASPPGPEPLAPGVTVRWARYAPLRSAARLAHGAGIPDNVRRRPLLALQAPALVGALAAEIVRRRRRWDGAISHWLVPSGALASALAGGLPHVAVAHSADLWLLERLPGGGRLVAAIAARSTALAAGSPALVERVGRLGGPATAARTLLLPLGPCSMPRASAREVVRLRASIHAGDLVVAFLGRLVAIKGAEVLVRALARPGCEGVRALVAGDGPDRSRLEALAERLGARARFLGEVGPERRAALLEVADALVVPSLVLPSGRTEGTPVAAIEGLAAGLPVVASRVGGLPWAVGDGGLLVAPGSPDELAAALARLARDRELRARLAAAARERARAFGWPEAAARLEALLGAGGAA